MSINFDEIKEKLYQIIPIDIKDQVMKDLSNVEPNIELISDNGNDTTLHINIIEKECINQCIIEIVFMNLIDEEFGFIQITFQDDNILNVFTSSMFIFNGHNILKRQL